MSYIMELRKFVGSRPLLACGSAVIIIDENNNVLMQRRVDNDCWGFIGGTMELGESLEETAKRETLEEVGIELGNIDFFKVYSGKDLYYKYPNGHEVYNVVNVFISKGICYEVNIDNYEVKEAKYFAYNQLPERINPPDIPIAIDIKKYISDKINDGV